MDNYTAKHIHCVVNLAQQLRGTESLSPTGLRSLVERICLTRTREAYHTRPSASTRHF
jgi:hypothetical protein